ncbi:MAG: putative quinol monooxygenase [Bauldia sp.]
MKYVIGWLKVKPGKRDELMKIARPVVAKTQKEDGCLFYELHPTTDDPDLILIVEGWESDAHHQAHQKAAHHVAFGPDVVRLSIEGRFEEIVARDVVSVRPKF